MPQNYFNPGTWQPAPFNPGTGGDQYGFNPAPMPQPRYTPENPYMYLPQPTPGVVPSPYVPSDPGAVLPPPSPTAYMRPVGGGSGPLPSISFGNIGGRILSPFSSGVREGVLDRLLGAGAGILGSMSGVPLGGLIAGLLYDRMFNAQNHMETFCILCGTRKFYHNFGSEDREAQWLLKMEQMRAGISISSL